MRVMAVITSKPSSAKTKFASIKCSLIPSNLHMHRIELALDNNDKLSIPCTHINNNYSGGIFHSDKVWVKYKMIKLKVGFES